MEFRDLTERARPRVVDTLRDLFALLATGPSMDRSSRSRLCTYIAVIRRFGLIHDRRHGLARTTQCLVPIPTRTWHG